MKKGLKKAPSKREETGKVPKRRRQMDKKMENYCRSKARR